jgi:hypothetical protein
MCADEMIPLDQRTGTSSKNIPPQPSEMLLFSVEDVDGLAFAGIVFFKSSPSGLLPG